MYDYFQPGNNYGLQQDWQKAGLQSRPEFVRAVRQMEFEGGPKRQAAQRRKLINNFWGPGGRPAYMTPLGRSMADQDPTGTFYRHLSQRVGGAPESSRFGQYARNQYDEVFNAFRAAQQVNPLLRFDDFLGRSGAMANMDARYRMLTPNQRGEQGPSMQARWV
jgi:hypothetical protein